MQRGVHLAVRFEQVGHRVATPGARGIGARSMPRTGPAFGELPHECLADEAGRSRDDGDHARLLCGEVQVSVN